MSNLAKKLTFVVASVVSLKLIIGATLKFTKPDRTSTSNENRDQ